MIIMGLDVSTTTVGLGIIEVIDNNLKLLHYEFFKPPKLNKVGELGRLIKTKEYIIEKLDQFNPDVICIEEFSKFMGGKSRASTIIPLAIINRTVCLTILEKTGKAPITLNVNTVRAKLKLTKERPSKEEMPSIVAKHLGLDEFPWQYKINRRTKLKELIIENEDIADSLSCALYCAKTIKCD